MYNNSFSNTGYIGQSRSLNSQDAIENYRVPMNMINGITIQNFQSDNSSNKYKNDIFNLKISIWKYVAELIGTSEYHHTGRYFSPTSHYSLWKVADYLDEHYQEVQLNYEKQKKQKYKAVKLAVIQTKDWHEQRFTSKWGKITKKWIFDGLKMSYGFIKNNQVTVYNDSSHSKCSIFAKKVVEYETISNLHDFKNYLLTKYNIKLDVKSFIQFLHLNTVDCAKSPNPNNENDMSISHDLEKDKAIYIKKQRAYKRKMQYKYNIDKPMAKELRKYVKDHKYNEFVAMFKNQYPDYNDIDLVSSINCHVYFNGVFKMPSHLKIWLKDYNK